MAAEVVRAPQADGQLFHQPAPRRSSPSSSSSPLFLAGSTTPPLRSSTRSPSQLDERRDSLADSPPISSLNSSPRQSTTDFSNIPSFRSTPISSSLSLQDQYQKEDDDIDFPNYDSLQGLQMGDDKDTRSSHVEDIESEALDTSTDTGTTISDSPIPTPNVVDDTAIKEEPTRHVDYLSHNWREEDIWSSWRHIVSQRKVYGQKSRLENASWRTWAQVKEQLRTVPPARLNWEKDADVTWLYGPLKPAGKPSIASNTNHGDSTQLSKNSSFVNKKPILKKRSVSEVMLQNSLSTSSLVKQAAASVQAQTKNTRSGLARSSSESTFPHSNPPSRDELDYFSSQTSSSCGGDTPSDAPAKHIRFDEKVEQCIAVECKGNGLYDESEPEPPSSTLFDSDSDEGLCMSRGKRKERRPRDASSKARPSNSNSASAQMIETLPSTTLKSRKDSPDADQTSQQHHVFGEGWGRHKLSPSPSQETLRPSRPSRNFLLGDDDDGDDEGDASNTWSFGANNPRSSLGASASAESSSSRTSYEGLEGMRRTESGMFVPYDEDEDDMVATGLFGRVSETFNTFKDIGYVLYNVGWRK